MGIKKILKINANLPISKEVVISIIHTTCLVNSKLNDVLKPYGVSLQQFNVLRILRGQNQNPVTLSTVQERMIAKMSNTTRLVDKLAKKGYVEKKINKDNRRKIDISITNEGLLFLEEISKLIDSTEKDIISSLTKDEAYNMIRLLDKIRLIANK
ncbi:MarR family winged helix-turn-helix transcriptional regulator [Seonamhaeicola aphaedonensis]|uniref:DNA-binding MarR family transcriptional regulator n=1 Tax=Seonamhaeicola aphaedonensis TaxID=1461338 RepID=A0A3D9HFP2_9FLAO|nr:MarR family transcriptional regulator [Seonamhaeicola aphaedonensis]RED48309.1 DNA-binding MarR family transcriptional regulator [Seonamhaeicola aphaedonensis]